LVGGVVSGSRIAAEKQGYEQRDQEGDRKAPLSKRSSGDKGRSSGCPTGRGQGIT
jgi:hypothetical protein